MGDTSFTPGPYALHPVKAWVVCPQLDADGQPCPVAALAWPTEYRSEAETRANGHLFAAATELYEALEGVCDLSTAEIASQDPRYAVAFARAVDALRKARGEIA